MNVREWKAVLSMAAATREYRRKRSAAISNYGAARKIRDAKEVTGHRLQPKPYPMSCKGKHYVSRRWW